MCLSLHLGFQNRVTYKDTLMRRTASEVHNDLITLHAKWYRISKEIMQDFPAAGDHIVTDSFKRSFIYVAS